MIKANELEQLINYYRDGKLAHAYLISTNNIYRCEEILLKVIKNIFCNAKFSENCNKCSLCHLIDIKNLPSLKIISPDGQMIKKNQILELKNDFSKSSQITNQKVYIIRNCEKMNKESANTLLKFIEEPVDNVIGFFITNHIDNVMLTIQSRCQIIEVNFENDLEEKYGLDKEEFANYLDLVKKYLIKIEIEKKESILVNRELMSELEKEDIIKVFQIILNIYQAILIKSNTDINYNQEFNFLNKYTFKNISKKINLVIEFLKEITYNVNIDLLLDRFVIEMDGINNESI